MKIIKLTIVAIALTSLSSLAFGSLEFLGQNKIDNTQTKVPENKNLLKKWALSHYEILGSNYDPKFIEKNDYIHFYKNNTYSSISEGEFGKGNYRLVNGTIIMTNSIEKGELKLMIKKLSENKLEVVIDNSSDSDAKYLTIHFKN